MRSSSFDRCEHRVAAALARSSALDGQSDCPAHANMPRSLAWSPEGQEGLRLDTYRGRGRREAAALVGAAPEDGEGAW